MILRTFVMFLLVFGAVSARADEAPTKPDVLFIVVDDLNDWIELLDTDAPIKTPNLCRLAKRGLLFTRACCASPACNPSRTATLTGLAPSTSGVYGNTSDWRAALPKAVTIPQHFMAQGYRVEGAGKIFHHHLDGAFHDDASFDDYRDLPWPLDAPMPKRKLNGLADYGSPNTDWGAWPPNEEDAVDVKTVDWCIERLGESSDQPRFLACGIFRPHMPFFAPEQWIGRYPLEDVVMPTIESKPLDLPPGAIELRTRAAEFWNGMMRAERQFPGSYRDAVRCYQATATFADAQVGRLLDALDASGRSDNTIIVLWSDHGYQLGEKGCWEKFTLWEKATRVPFIVVAPGVTQPNTRCDQPVSLLDLYPTLIDVCRLDPISGLDGKSLFPLLKNPDTTRDRPAVMTYMRDNHAVRSARWRYIRYADGSEELYDHQNDPHEWNNLALDSKYAAVLAEHRQWIPDQSAKPAPDMKRKKN